MSECTARRPFNSQLSCAMACLALATSVLAADSLPPVTASDRAAAFPDVTGAPMHAHMHEDQLTAMLRFDELEWQDRSTL